MEIVDAIGVRLNQLRKPPPHRDHAGLRECKRQDFLGRRFCFPQNIRDTDREDLGLPRAGTRDHHHRPFGRVNRLPLFVVQPRICFLEVRHEAIIPPAATSFRYVRHPQNKLAKKDADQNIEQEKSDGMERGDGRDHGVKDEMPTTIADSRAKPRIKRKTPAHEI